MVDIPFGGVVCLMCLKMKAPKVQLPAKECCGQKMIEVEGAFEPVFPKCGKSEELDTTMFETRAPPVQVFQRSAHLRNYWTITFELFRKGFGQ